MTIAPSFPSSREPSGWIAGLRGVAVAAGAALLLTACGRHQDGMPPAPAPSAAKPAASVATPARVPAAAGTAGARQPSAAQARARLASMEVPELLAAAREAYGQHRLVSPAGDNAMADYEAVLARDPHNQVASDALREIFPFSVPDVEKAISRNNVAEASREIELLAKADPTNYTLTLLRAKLDAQKKLKTRQQQQAQQKAQRSTELAAAEQAAANKAAAEKEAATKLANEKAEAARVVRAARPSPKPRPAAPPPPPRPTGETRGAEVVAPFAPQFPIQAAREGVSGYVVVEFTVSATGAVEHPHVVDSAPRHVFDDAALQAIKRTRFKPALENGKPVAATLRRRINFDFHQ